MTPRGIRIALIVTLAIAGALAFVRWGLLRLSDPTLGVPGYDSEHRPQDDLLGNAACTHCHVQIVSPHPAKCEACHGGGWAHVSEVGMGRRPGSIQAFSGGSGRERVRACAACHGAPTALRNVDLLSRPALGANRPATGILMSACFAAVDGPTCDDCHSEHAGRRRDSGGRRAVCVACHAGEQPREARQCSKEPEGQCLGCHMPKMSTGSTDHWLRVPSWDPVPAEIRAGSPLLKQRADRLKSLILPEIERAEGTHRGYLLANLGRLEAMLAERSAAIDDLRRAASTLPRDAEVHFSLGEVLEATGSAGAADAVRALETAIALAPDHRRARIALARIHRFAGRPGQAQAQLLAALRSDRTDSTALWQLASLRLEDGKVADGLRLLRRALKLDPQLLDARSEYATALYKVGRLSDALAQYRVLKKAWPNSALVAGAIQVLEKELGATPAAARP